MSHLKSSEAHPADLTAPASIVAKLSNIWEEALDGPIEDQSASFFDNGGDSLGATMVLTRIKEEFGVDLSLETFFDAPTLVALATALSASVAEV